MNSAILTGIAFALYLSAAVCYGASLFLDAPAAPQSIGTGTSSNRPLLYAVRFLAAGILSQFLAVGANCAHTHHSPFASVYGTLMVAAWAIAIVYLAWDRRAKMPAVGAVAMLTDCIILGFADSQAHSRIARDPVLSHPVVSLHVLAIIGAYGLILVASGCAVMYLIENRMLKKHSRNSILRKFPPLTSLDSIAYQCIAYATPLLTIGLGVAISLIFAGGVKGSPREWFLGAQFISTAILLTLFTLYLAARLAVGWRGVRLQYILLIGILCAFAAFALPTAAAHHFN